MTAPSLDEINMPRRGLSRALASSEVVLIFGPNDQAVQLSGVRTDPGDVDRVCIGALSAAFGVIHLNFSAIILLTEVVPMWSSGKMLTERCFGVFRVCFVFT